MLVLKKNIPVNIWVMIWTNPFLHKIPFVWKKDGWQTNDGCLDWGIWKIFPCGWTERGCRFKEGNRQYLLSLRKLTFSSLLGFGKFACILYQSWSSQEREATEQFEQGRFYIRKELFPKMDANKEHLKIKGNYPREGEEGEGFPPWLEFQWSGLYGSLPCNRGQSPSTHCGSKLAEGRLPALHQWNCQKLLQWGHAEHSKKQAVVPTEIPKKLPSMTLWTISREMLPYGCAELPGQTFHGKQLAVRCPS